MILLFSGGLDSYIAWHILGKPKTVYFDLGTPYSAREIKYIRKLIPGTIIDSSLKLGDMQVQGKSAFLPFRNLFIAMMATKYDREICIAGVRDDKVIDKSEEAFLAMTKCLSGIDSLPTRIFSPFWGLTKADIVGNFINHGYGMKEDLLGTISCYSGTEPTNYCGRCRCCFRKWNALWVNGIRLPFHDADIRREYYESAQNEKYDPQRNQHIMLGVLEYESMNSYLVDIDGILTNETQGHDFISRTPNNGNIACVNSLYQGNIITLYSSRLEEDREVTVEWMKKHGVKYHMLILGKQYGDVYIDDKACNHF